MKNNRKKILAIILIILVLALGGAAIFVSIRLQQAQIPTAPVSKPRAAEWLGGGNCTVSFAVAAASVLTCEQKTAYKDDGRNTAGNYYLTAENRLTATDPLTAGQTIVYAISYKNTGSASVASSTITDILDSKLTFVDSDSGCSYSSVNRTVTCAIGEVVAGANSQVAIRAKVNGDATPGTISNTATVTGSNNCTVALAIPTVTATATATVTPAPAACSRACPNQEGVVEESYKCQGGMWRNKDCPTTDNDACVCPTETGAPIVTRTPAPTTPPPTRTPRATRTPTPTREISPTAAKLPETGILNLPGAAAFGGGLLLTVLGILFAL